MNEVQEKETDLLILPLLDESFKQKTPKDMPHVFFERWLGTLPLLGYQM